MGASTSAHAGKSAWVLVPVSVAVAGSSTTMVSNNQVQSITHVVVTNNAVSSNSSSFALQNVSYEIPRGTLPQLTSLVLELVPLVEHIGVHSYVVDQLRL